MLSRPHKYRAGNSLDRASDEVVAVVFIEVEQIFCRGYMSCVSTLRAEGVEIILAVVVQRLRDMYETLGIEYDLRHKIYILVHTEFRYIDSVVGI